MKEKDLFRSVVSLSSSSYQNTVRISSRSQLYIGELFTNWNSLDFVFIILIAVYVFRFEYLPLQDYPNWLYQGFIFNEYVFHANTFNGFFHLRPYIPPNAISTVFIGVLSTFMSVFMAGKIFIFITASLLYWGTASYLILFIKDRKALISFVAFYLVFNVNFLMGFLNYCFGFGITLLVIVYFVRHDLKVSRAVGAVLFLLLYLSHFVALFLVMAFLALYAYHKKKFRLLRPLLLAIVPVIILFLQYYFFRQSEDLNFVPYREDLYYRFHMVIHWLLSVTIPFHHYKWLLAQPPLFEGLNFLSCAITSLVIFYTFFSAWKKGIWSLELRMALLLFIPIVLLPDYLGGLLYPSNRFVILFLLNILVLYFSERRSKFKERLTFIIVFLMVVTSYFYNLFYAYQFDTQAASETVTLESLIQNSYAWEGTNGFEHHIFYHGITHHEILSPFRSGLFDYPVNCGGISFENR